MRRTRHTAPAALLERAEATPEAAYLRWLPTGEPSRVEPLTYGALAAGALDVARALAPRVEPGGRVLLLFPPGPEFALGFFGCMFAGAIPVPAYTPDPARMERSLRRLRAIVADAGAGVVLTTAAVQGMARALEGLAPDLAALHWLAVDALPEPDGDRRPGPAIPDEGDLAFLQYTSGSTGSPRGVMLTHGNVMHNVWQVWRTGGFAPTMDVVGWVPVHHDMGMITTVLWQLWRGGETTLMSPLHFIQRPVRWLQVLSATGADVSAGPTFAYDLLARKVTDAELAGLDLSAWSHAVVSAEPVRQASLERFAQRFSPAGFRREAFNPCYGLAESTVIVTGRPADSGAGTGCMRSVPTLTLDPVALQRGRLEPAASGAVLVSSGVPLETELVVVGPDTCRPLVEDRIGEIWLSGASVGQGYWGREEDSRARFQARLATDARRGPFLRTGDLGFLHGGELYVTGRQKDLIIIGGANVHPQDVEAAAEGAHRAVRPGCSAAFALERDGTEGIGLAVELDPRGDPDIGALDRQVRAAVLAEVGHPLDTLYVLEKGRLPKTSSGKLQRALTREELLDGRIEPLSVTFLPSTEALLAEVWSQVLGRDRVAVDIDFFALGGRSIQAMEVVAELERRLGRTIPPAWMLRGATIESLAAWIEGHGPGGSSVVPLQPRGTRTPLFLFHGMSGSVANLKHVASRFAPHRPVFGIEARGLGADVPPLTTVDAMATEYTERLEAFWPDGPVHLGGYSFGGVVAWEVARTLAGRGREVRLLALLDADVPPHGRSIRAAAHRIAWRVRGRVSELRGRRRAAPVRRAAAPLADRLLTLRRACQRAWVDHEPGPYDGRVAWLRTAGNGRSSGFGWEDLASDLTTVPIAGSHLGCLRGAHGDALARTLEDLCSEADRAFTAERDGPAP